MLSLGSEHGVLNDGLVQPTVIVKRRITVTYMIESSIKRMIRTSCGWRRGKSFRKKLVGPYPGNSAVRFEF